MSSTLNVSRPVGRRFRIRAFAEGLATFVVRRRERRADRRNRTELRELPDHILRDIGIARGDIPWLVAELRRTGKGRPERSWNI